MIVKGRSRGDGGQLANYLLYSAENENVMVLEAALGLDGNGHQGVIESLAHFDAMASFTKGYKGHYHAQISPEHGYRLTHDQWIEAVDIAAGELGLDQAPRAVVLHEKNGAIHGHVVFMRTLQRDNGAFILHSDSRNYEKHERAARKMEHVFGHDLVRGAFYDGYDTDRNEPVRREPGIDRPGYDAATETRVRHDQAEAQRMERTGISKEQRQAEITALWQRSDNGQSFKAALENAGYGLARGDQKDIYMVMDRQGEAYALGREIAIKGLRKKDIEARLEGFPLAELPSVSEVREARKLALRAPDLGPQFATASREPDLGRQFATAAHGEGGQREERGAADIARSAEPDPAVQEEQRRQPTGDGRVEQDDQGKIEAWANAIRARAQSRERDERRQMERQHDQRAAREEEQLRRQYGGPGRRLEQQIEAIEQRQAQGGFLYWLNFWQRKADRENLPNLQASLENTRQRESEARATYQAQRAQERENLAHQQEQQRQVNERYIAWAFESGRIYDIVRGRSADRAHEQPQQDRGGWERSLGLER